MFAILGNIFAALLWGGLLALVLLLLIYVLLILLVRLYQWTWWKIIIICISFLFFIIQGSLLVGAFYASSYVDDVKQIINELVNSSSDAYSQTDIVELKNALIDDYPILSPFVQEVELTGENMIALKDVFVLEISNAISAYKWRRVAWIAGTFILSLILLLWNDLWGSSSRNVSYRRDRVQRDNRLSRRPRATVRRARKLR